MENEKLLVTSWQHTEINFFEKTFDRIIFMI